MEGTHVVQHVRKHVTALKCVLFVLFHWNHVVQNNTILGLQRLLWDLPYKRQLEAC